MSDEISKAADGQDQVVVGRGIPAWHHKGVVVEGLMTAEEAIKHAQLDYEVEKTPLYVQPLTKVKGWMAVRRTDTKTILGVVQSKYTLIQNSRAFSFFDEVIGKGQAVYDTAGALKDGALVWLMAKLSGKCFIGNDEHEKNVLLALSHNRLIPLTLKVVLTRVVCWNTISIALREHSNEIKIRHTEKFEERMLEAQKALELAEAYFSDLAGLLNKLQQTEMSAKEMESFTAQVFPAVEKIEDGKIQPVPTRTANIRDTVQNLFANGQGNLGRNRFDALNAVTEYVDHARPIAKKTDRFEANLFGSGVDIKRRALNLLAD